ncbi:MAG TPA: hypothetical protein VIV60_22460 [Polyangiaceae bacterium]
MINRPDDHSKAARTSARRGIGTQIRAAFARLARGTRMLAHRKLLIGAPIIGSLLGAAAGWYSLPRPSSQAMTNISEHHATERLQAERSDAGKSDAQSTDAQLTRAIGSDSGGGSTGPAGFGQSGAVAGASSRQRLEASSPPEEEPYERVYSVIEWLPPSDPIATDLRCTAGEGLDCLRMAAAANGLKTLPSINVNRRNYLERAFSLLVLQCRRRVPDACAIIARMHAKEFGLSRDPANESALIARARQLCLRHPGKVCVVFDR